jgi:hypothetical protein
MKNKNTFNNFVDFGSHIQKKKAQSRKVAFEKLSKNVFVHSLEHLTYDEIRSIVVPEKIEYLDLIFENRKNILFDKCEMDNYIYRNIFTVVYSLNIENSAEKIDLKVNFEIINDGYMRDFEIKVYNSAYLTKDFINQYTLNNYTEEDSQVVKLYKKVFNDKQLTKDMYPHMVSKQRRLIVNDSFKYIIEYELHVKRKIHAGLSRVFLKFASTTAFKTDNHFVERLTSLLESDYTLPLLDKKIVDLTEDDITVLKMSVI